MSHKFHLGDVLTITTGLLVSPRHMVGVYDILNYMTGQNLYTHQLIRAMEVCKSELVKQYPWLTDVVVLERPLPEGKIVAWLTEQVARFGVSKLDVAPLSNNKYVVMDPVEELAWMSCNKPIVVVIKDNDMGGTFAVLTGNGHTPALDV